VTSLAKDEVLARTTEYFPPELLNRLDSMLVFNKLSRQSILQVVNLRLNDVQNRLKNRRITLDVDDHAREWLVKKGYSDVYGARAIARVVRTDVLFPMAQKLLKGTVRYVFQSYLCSCDWRLIPSCRDGDTVIIRVDGDKLDIKDNHPPDAEAVNQTSQN
jgi:ATP-dependent Clp protease ATP-binding subunit ClpB